TRRRQARRARAQTRAVACVRSDHSKGRKQVALRTSRTEKRPVLSARQQTEHPDLKRWLEKRVGTGQPTAATTRPSWREEITSRGRRACISSMTLKGTQHEKEHR